MTGVREQSSWVMAVEIDLQFIASKGYTRRFKRSRFSRAFFSSRSLAHLTMMANRKKKPNY
jgi:hypothetical protein